MPPVSTAVSTAQVLAWRMNRQFLTTPAPDAVTVAGRLCGVQAQVASAAALAVSVRLGRPAAGELAAALGPDRTLVKLWATRGTLHLAPPRLAARFCAVIGSFRTWEKPVWLRNFGVTQHEMDALHEAIAAVLPGQRLTREELAAQLVSCTGSAHLAQALGSGWGALLKPATYLGLLCHGPPRGSKVTFTAPSTWLPGWRLPEPDGAGRALVRDYLSAYGPSTHDDFARWLHSNAKPKVTKGWFANLEGELARVDVDGRPALLLAADVDELAATAPATGVTLLGSFDQYVIAVNRGLIPDGQRAKVSRKAGWISPVVLHQGRIAGVWTEEAGQLRVDPFEPLPDEELGAAFTRIAALMR